MSIDGDATGEKPAFGIDPRVAVGTPKARRLALGLDPRVAASPQGNTGQYLKQVLKRRPNSRAAKRAAEAAE